MTMGSRVDIISPDAQMLLRVSNVDGDVCNVMM